MKNLLAAILAHLLLLIVPLSALAGGNPPSGPGKTAVDAFEPLTFLEFRNFENGLQKFQVYTTVPAGSEFEVAAIRLYDPAGALVHQSRTMTWSEDHSFFAEPGSGTGPVAAFESIPSMGFSLHFEDLSVPFPAGTYTLETERTTGVTEVQAIDFPGQIVLAPVQAVSMSSQVNGDETLTFRWTPAPPGPQNQQRVNFFDDRWGLILRISLETDASEVTLPENLLATALGSRPTSVIRWRIENRYLDGSGLTAARSLSDSLTLTCGVGVVCALDPLAVDDDRDGYTELAGDCRDDDYKTHPAGIEVCGDGIDQDCDGSDMPCDPDLELRTSVADLGVIDAHAHPGKFYKQDFQGEIPAGIPALNAILEAGLCASSFSATGDNCYQGDYQVCLDDTANTTTALNRVLALTDSGILNLVLTGGDLADSCSKAALPGAILTMEGADALAGDRHILDQFYAMGVRSLQLVHYRNNELGDLQASWKDLDPGPYRGGLSNFGRQVIRRMEKLGMVIDVSHASAETLEDILSIARQPVIDSHGGPRYHSDPTQMRRLRSWRELDMIAANGGVVCSWPVLYTISGAPEKNRVNFDDWADEVVAMRNRLGIEHVGLGTDADGLPAMIEGYLTVDDLVPLANALQVRGFTDEDLRAFFGGNLQRIFSGQLRE